MSDLVRYSDLQQREKVLLGAMQKVISAQEAIKDDPELALAWQNLYTGWVHLSNARKTVGRDLTLLKKELKKNGSI